MSSIQVLRVHEVELHEDPIEPSWVLEGAPRARASTWLTSRDGTVSGFVWDCTAGRFRWYFDEDETVHVVEGSVTVEADDVAPVTLTVGDAAHFAAGTWAVWQVDEHVRKHAILRPHLPTPIAVQARGWRGLTLRLRRARSRDRAGRAAGRA